MFFALTPLKKPSRMEEIVSGITGMSDEETNYGFSKCSKTKHSRRAQKSLRIPLSGE